MIGWIIFAAVILLVAFLLFRYINITAVVEKDIEVRVRYWLFTVFRYPSPPKRKKPPKAKKTKIKKQKPERKSTQAQTAGSGENSGSTESGDSSHGGQEKESEAVEQTDAKAKPDEKPAQKPKKSLPKIDLDMIKDYIESAKPPMKRLFKKIRFRDIYVDYVVGSDDAAVTAMKYGAASAFIYSAVRFLTTYFDTKVGEINIEADFSAEKDDYFFYLTVKLRLSTLIGCGLWLGVRALRVFLRYNKKAKPAHKGTNKRNQNKRRAKAGN